MHLRLPASLHGRMALAVSVLLLLATVVTAFALARRTAQLQFDAQETLGRNLGNLVADSAAHLIARGDVHGLHSLLSKIIREPAVAAVRIRDHRARVLYEYAHTHEPPSALTRVLSGRTAVPVVHAEFPLEQTRGQVELELSYQPLNDSLRALAVYSSLVSGGLLLAAIVLIYSLLRRFTAPLTPLVEMARQVSEGNWMPDVKLTPSASREIQQLNQAFTDGANTMRRYIGNLEETRALLAQSAARLRNLIDGMHEALFELDTEGRITFLNPAWHALTGFTIDQALHKPFSEFVMDRDVALDFGPEFLNELREKNREISLKTANGRQVWVNLMATAQVDADGRFTCVIGSLYDITQRIELHTLLKRHEDELYHLSVTDPLTGLYNRRHFDTALEMILKDHLIRNQSVCLIIIDLDRFKFINDTFGHPFGDQVLRATAELLSRTVRGDDYIARLGGDEFAMVLKNASLEDASRIAHKLHATLSDTRMALPVGQIQLQCSIGIAEAPTHGRNAQALVTAADVALYQSKRQGRNRIEILAPDISKAVMSIFSQGFKLRSALDAGAIHPALQPIYDLRNHTLIGYEALARMRHAGGTVCAQDFIALAEELGLAGEVDLHIIQQALALAPKGRTLFLNVSLNSFNDREFVDGLRALLAPACGAGRDIVIEITERVTIPLTVTFLQDLEGLRRLGCKLALDDFGSGYSTFHFLASVRPEYLKIDGAFVRGMLRNQTDYKIVKHICALAADLGIHAIAESVEDEAIFAALTDIGITNGQGWYLGMPVAEAEAALLS